MAAASFVTLESSIIAKSPDRACEDGLVVTEHHGAVIDGATTPHAVGTDGRTSGRIAMEALVDVVTNLHPAATLENFLDLAAPAIAAAAQQAGLVPDLPTAVAVIYSAHHRQVWLVGDALAMIDDTPISAGQRTMDALAAQARAAILRAALLQGASVEELAAADPGRAGTVALREAKVVFRNNVQAGDLAFAALTGTRVPTELTSVHDVRRGAHVVLTSDGYPEPAGTLEEAESALARALAADPLCIDVLATTKCPAAPGLSFDDRTYLSLRTA